MKLTVAVIFFCTIFLSFSAFAEDNIRTVTIFDSAESQVVYGLMGERGTMVLWVPEDETLQGRVIEYQTAHGKVHADGHLEMWDPETRYIITTGTMDDQGELIVSNNDGTYSYGIVK